jgi:phage terminase large subunit
MAVTVDLSNILTLMNKRFYPLLFNESRHLVLMGGGGSGKSKFSAQKIVYRMIAEKNHRFMVVRKVGDTLRDSVFADMIKVINEWGLEDLFYIPNGRSSEIYIKCKLNGNEALFYGLDKVEKRKSIEGITNIWIEEASECTTDDFRQLNIRMRGKSNYNQMIISFNPIDINHWLKKEFFDIKKPDALTMHSTYKDNPFLDEGTKKELEAFKVTDPYYYQVYCLGEWGVFGKTIFNAQIVNQRIADIRDKKPLRQGFFIFQYVNDKIVDKSIEWIEDENGYIKVYEEVKPRHPYALGGDTAGDGSDNFTGHIVNNITGNQAAVLKHQFDEDLYTRQMYCLGKHYNDALMGIETNFSTFPVKESERLGYRNQFIREVADTFTGSVQKKYGFNTNRMTRPLIIAALVKIVRENVELINDIDTLYEMLTFVRNEKGRPEAQEGSNDDLIIGLAITHNIRGQQEMKVAELIIESKPLPFAFRTEEEYQGGIIKW